MNSTSQSGGWRGSMATAPRAIAQMRIHRCNKRWHTRASTKKRSLDVRADIDVAIGEMRMKLLPTAKVDDGACSMTGNAGPFEPHGKVVGSVSSAQPDLGAAPLKESRELRH